VNQLQKNIALWIVISLIFVFLFQMFNQPQTKKEEIVYSDFIAYLNKGQVTDVTIQGENIEGRLSDGKTFKLYAPQDPHSGFCTAEKRGENCSQTRRGVFLVYDHYYIMAPDIVACWCLDLFHEADAGRWR